MPFTVSEDACLEVYTVVFYKANEAVLLDHALFCLQNEYSFLKKLLSCVSYQTSSVNICIIDVSPLQIPHCLVKSHHLNINIVCFSYARTYQHDYLGFWLVQREYLHKQWYWTFCPKFRKIQQQNHS